MAMSRFIDNRSLDPYDARAICKLIEGQILQVMRITYYNMHDQIVATSY